MAVFTVRSPDHPGPACSLAFDSEEAATEVVDFIHRVAPDVRLTVQPNGVEQLWRDATVDL